MITHRNAVRYQTVQSIHHVPRDLPLVARVFVDDIAHVADKDDALWLDMFDDPARVGVEDPVDQIRGSGRIGRIIYAVLLRVGNDDDAEAAGRSGRERFSGGPAQPAKRTDATNDNS